MKYSLNHDPFLIESWVIDCSKLMTKDDLWDALFEDAMYSKGFCHEES